MAGASERLRVVTVGVEGQTSQCSDPIIARPVTASIEPLLRKRDIGAILRVDIRTLERMLSSGRMPKPDMYLRRAPRWKPETIRQWIDQGGEK
jgi:hypothetical protein